LKFELATLPPKEVNDAFGTRLNTKPMLDEKTGAPAAITYKICRKWLNPAYLGTNGTGTAKGAGEAAAGTAAAPEAADPESNTKTILSIIAAKRPGKKGQVKSLQQLSGLLTQQYTTLKMPPKEMVKCQGYVKDKDWLNVAFLDLGIMDADGNPTVVSDDGSITFPDAA
jgi:hypothetical protein